MCQASSWTHLDWVFPKAWWSRDYPSLLVRMQKLRKKYRFPRLQSSWATKPEAEPNLSLFKSPGLVTSLYCLITRKYLVIESSNQASEAWWDIGCNYEAVAPLHTLGQDYTLGDSTVHGVSGGRLGRSLWENTGIWETVWETSSSQRSGSEYSFCFETNKMFMFPWQRSMLTAVHTCNRVTHTFGTALA